MGDVDFQRAPGSIKFGQQEGFRIFAKDDGGFVDGDEVLAIGVKHEINSTSVWRNWFSRRWKESRWDVESRARESGGVSTGVSDREPEVARGLL